MPGQIFEIQLRIDTLLLDFIGYLANYLFYLNYAPKVLKKVEVGK